jgi:hypothetical protein
MNISQVVYDLSEEPASITPALKMKEIPSPEKLLSAYDTTGCHNRGEYKFKFMVQFLPYKR